MWQFVSGKDYTYSSMFAPFRRSSKENSLCKMDDDSEEVKAKGQRTKEGSASAWRSQAKTVSESGKFSCQNHSGEEAECVQARNPPHKIAQAWEVSAGLCPRPGAILRQRPLLL